jgi:hypothetical protein
MQTVYRTVSGTLQSEGGNDKWAGIYAKITVRNLHEAAGFTTVAPSSGSIALPEV